MKASSQLCKLGDVAEITPGLSIPGAIQHTEGAPFQVIVSKHLTKGVDYVYNPEQDCMRMDLTDRAYKYVVNPGDILFMARGDHNLATYIMDCPPLCVATNTFYVLRAYADIVHPRYLAWVLNQLPAQSEITSYTKGVATPFVSRADLSKVSVTIPSMDEQIRIIEIDGLIQMEELLSERLLGLVKQRNQHIATQIATGSISLRQ